MKCLVTGAAGYIGGFLIEELLRLGHSVIAVDRFSRQNPDEIFGRNRNRLTPVKADLLHDLGSLNTYKNSIDIVFHLAGKNNSDDAKEKALEYHHGNVTATVRMLELSRHLGVSKFIYAASASCYGTPTVHPTPENYQADPQYIYATTKYLGECAVMHWGNIYKLPVTSLRMFSVYGPRTRKGQGSGLFISKFLDAVREKRPIIINGDGTQARDLVYITDVVRAYLMAAESSAVNEVFNVGTGVSISLNRIVALMGYPKTEHHPRPRGEADRTQADIRKIRRTLGWKPEVTIVEGIRRVLAEDKGK